jgi:hypothetical protein
MLDPLTTLGGENSPEALAATSDFEEVANPRGVNGSSMTPTHSTPIGIWVKSKIFWKELFHQFL